MDILYGQYAGSAERPPDQVWNSNNLYTFASVQLELSSSSTRDVSHHGEFVNAQPPLVLYTPPYGFIWPSLPPEIQQTDRASYLLPSSLPSYSIQTPTPHSLPSSTDSHRTQQQRTKDKSHKSDIRCWSHNCGGRRFSSMGNYRRHLREKGGSAKRHQCEDCGRFFTRSTSRNAHRRLGICRKRKIAPRE